MSKKSSFTSDLSKEKKLSILLDNYYLNYLKHYTFQRINNKKEQFQGIDVKFTHKETGSVYHIDEKAQLDYINEDLPTFAFEISYLKDGTPKTGWLFDPLKTTDFYALATGIFSDGSNGFIFCKITMVNRKKLIKLLKEKNITEQRLLDSFSALKSRHGKILIDELSHKKEGYLFYSKSNKAERPLNLVLKLDWLIQLDVAKRLV